VNVISSTKIRNLRVRISFTLMDKFKIRIFTLKIINYAFKRTFLYVE
jgi:hypothetical protein